MKTIPMIAAAAALMGLVGCGGGYHDRYANTDGGYYDGYYDGYYGPYAGGYWGTDGYFYYSDGHGTYHRDDEHHFRHDHFEHGMPFRADHVQHDNDD